MPECSRYRVGVGIGGTRDSELGRGKNETEIEPLGTPEGAH